MLTRKGSWKGSRTPVERQLPTISRTRMTARSCLKTALNYEIHVEGCSRGKGYLEYCMNLLSSRHSMCCFDIRYASRWWGEDNRQKNLQTLINTLVCDYVVPGDQTFETLFETVRHANYVSGSDNYICDEYRCSCVTLPGARSELTRTTRRE